MVQAAQSQATRSDPLPLGYDPCREGGTPGAFLMAKLEKKSQEEADIPDEEQDIEPADIE